MELKTETLSLFRNPFVRIAGGTALGWGIIGIIVSIYLAYQGQLHYHGLLQFGPGPNQAWWCFTAEHLIVWLIPALLFYIGGWSFSVSRIRALDVFGTVAFAQLPFVVMNLFYLPASVRQVMNTPIEEWLTNPDMMGDMLWVLPSMLFLVWTLIWMFFALKVSCNLKGGYLWLIYFIAVIGGDILCRYLIGWIYQLKV